MKRVYGFFSFMLLFFLMLMMPASKSRAAEELRQEPPVFVAGRQVKSEEEARKVLEDTVEKRLSLTVSVAAGDGVYTFTAAQLGLTWTNPGVETAAEAAASWSEKEMCGSLFGQDFIPTYDVNPEILRNQLEIIIAKETRQPVNGSVYRDENGYPKLDDGVCGRSFSLEQEFSKAVQYLLAQTKDGAAWQMEYTQIPPVYTGENAVFSETPLGEYTTYDLGQPGRVHNIELSAGGINGTLVMPGENLSALTMYGAVTAENGYEEAPVYNSGKQLMGIGGGVCQTTTTLYNACLRAELQIVYRRQHSMLVSYVPPSWDAMVDYASGSDFIAGNNTGFPIYLEASTGTDETGRSYINVRIWGVETRPANRTVEFTYDVLACEFPQNLIRVNAVNDSVTTMGLAMPNEKIYVEVDPHPFVQSRAYKVVKVDGVVQSTEALPGTYGSYDQYRPMEGTVYHASDCLVTYWVVEDAAAYLGKRVHYQVMFLNGQGWDPKDPAGCYGK